MRVQVQTFKLCVIRIVGFRNLFDELPELTGERQQSFIGKVDTYVALKEHRNDVWEAWLEITPPT